MNAELVKVVGAVAGAVGVLTLLVTSVFREIIRKNIFPKLTKGQAYRVVLSIIVLTSGISIFGIYVGLREDGRKSAATLRLIIDLDSIPWKQTSVEIPEMKFLAFTNSVGEIEVPVNQDRRQIRLVIGGVHQAEVAPKPGTEVKLYFMSQKFKLSEIGGVILNHGRPAKGVTISTEFGDSTETNDVGQFHLKVKSRLNEDMIYVTYSKDKVAKRVLVQVDQIHLTLDL